MFSRCLAFVICVAVLGGLGFETPSFAGKKDGPPDHHGVIVEVHRDDNKNDKDIGYIVVKTLKNNNVKVIVLKSTNIRRDTADVTFKGLDKGDVVLVWMKGASQHADKIVIRKN